MWLLPSFPSPTNLGTQFFLPDKQSLVQRIDLSFLETHIHEVMSAFLSLAI